MRGGAAKRKLGSEGALSEIRKQQRPELQAFLVVRGNPYVKQKFSLYSAFLARCDTLNLNVDMYFKELT
ncbi:hypothetical protein PDUR_11960 [Paenibacillus durus]|uniref:Uncharacterized protein n=1 Tax=Paenibacillus durus TaxID=44251 RepID=A0A089HKQ6_PAEDU|nr:hypothetical protein PDUR_11960 [Paenibacillus durus]